MVQASWGMRTRTGSHAQEDTYPSGNEMKQLYRPRELDTPVVNLQLRFCNIPINKWGVSAYCTFSRTRSKTPHQHHPATKSAVFRQKDSNRSEFHPSYHPSSKHGTAIWNRVRDRQCSDECYWRRNHDRSLTAGTLNPTDCVTLSLALSTVK